MIFVTVGSQKFQFNRLVKSIDELIACNVITESVIGQIGTCTYLPQNYKTYQYMDKDLFDKTLKVSDVVITHGGTGVIVNAVKARKKVIAVPRLACYGEHVDNHQLQLLEQFQSMDIIEVCTDISKLEDSIKYAKEHVFRVFDSNTDKIIKSINQYIEESF